MLQGLTKSLMVKNIKTYDLIMLISTTKNKGKKYFLNLVFFYFVDASVKT